MKFSDLLQWWNLVYLVPLAIGVTMIALSVFGAGGDEGDAGDAGGENAGSGDGDLGDAGAGEAEPQGDETGDGETSGKAKGSFTQTLGLHNVSPLMLLQNFLLFWGVVGWTVNQVLSQRITEPALFIVPSLAITLCGATVLTVALSSTLARLAPREETFVSRKANLVGRVGEAVSSITDKMGSVYVRDDAGTLHHLHSRTPSDAQPIAQGKSVLIVDYNPEGDYYLVKEWSP